MSIYSDCSQAISDLAALPEVFTEIDIVNRSSSDGWSKAMFKEARKYANQIVSAKYRNGELVRYGPVEYDGIRDYARRASMIVYGGAESGPETWDTPNGHFSQIPKHEDQIQSSGRRKGTARHDETPWGEQDLPENIKVVTPRRTAKRPASKDAGAELRRLQAELAQAQVRIGELEGLLASREHSGAESNGKATEATETDLVDLRELVESVVVELVSDYDARLNVVEDRVNRFTSALTG